MDNKFMQGAMIKSQKSKNLELAKLANPIYGKRSIIQDFWDSQIRTVDFRPVTSTKTTGIVTY